MPCIFFRRRCARQRYSGAVGCAPAIISSVSLSLSCSFFFLFPSPPLPPSPLKEKKVPPAGTRHYPSRYAPLNEAFNHGHGRPPTRLDFHFCRTKADLIGRKFNKKKKKKLGRATIETGALPACVEVRNRRRHTRFSSVKKTRPFPPCRERSFAPPTR